jgi:biopolymer transport protein ExbB
MTNIFEQGGPVVAFIFVLSIAAWCIIVWEWLRLHQQSGGDWRWVDGALDNIENNQPAPAGVVDQYRHNFIGRILAMQLRPASAHRHAFHTQVMPHLVSEEIALFRPLRIVAIIAGLMPLLGLLGTVLGMITTFDALLTNQVARIDALAGGISQALITTQVGLVAAVPVVLAHGYLQSRARSYIDTATVMLKRIESIVCYE